MFKKVITLAVVFVMIITSILTGCSGDSTETVGSSPTTSKSSVVESTSEVKALEPCNLRMWTFLDLSSTNPRAKVLGKIIDKFQKENPGVTVTVETQQWTTMTAKVIAAHVAKNAPDIFMSSAIDLGSAIKSGCFEPLENIFYNNWTDEQKSDVGNPIWQSGYDGTYHYQVPMFYGVFGIYYRSDLFKKFNIKVEDIKTWDNLTEVAQKLTYVDEKGAQVWGLGIGYSTEVSDAHGRLPAALFHEGMFTDDGYPNNWDGEAGVEALQWQLDLIDKYKVMPPSVMALTSEEIYNQFEAGQYAMIFGGSIRVPTVRSLSAFDPKYVQFMKFPANSEGEGSTTSVMGGWHCGIWSKGKNKEAAGRFLEMLASPDTEILWVTEADQLPLRASTIANYPEVFNKEENKYLVVCADIIANSGCMQPTNFTITDYLFVLQNAVIRSYVDGLTPKAALKEAADSFIKANKGR